MSPWKFGGCGLFKNDLKRQEQILVERCFQALMCIIVLASRYGEKYPDPTH